MADYEKNPLMSLFAHIKNIELRLAEKTAEVDRIKLECADIKKQQLAFYENLTSNVEELIEKKTCELFSLYSATLDAHILDVLRAEIYRKAKNTNEAIEDINKSLDDIVEAITNALVPFQEYLKLMQIANKEITNSIQQLDKTIKAIVDLSQPHANLANEIAWLLNESVTNINKTASAATQIVTVELRDAVDIAIKEIKEVSLKDTQQAYSPLEKTINSDDDNTSASITQSHRQKKDANSPETVLAHDMDEQHSNETDAPYYISIPNVGSTTPVLRDTRNRSSQYPAVSAAGSGFILDSDGPRLEASNRIDNERHKFNNAGQIFEVHVSGKLRGSAILTEIDSNLKSSVDLSIPDKFLYMYRPYTVIGIGEGAFRDCKSLFQVTLPNSIVKIGKAAFYNCKALTKIVIPNSVSVIDDEAFAGCGSLANIVLPKNLSKIGNYSFQGTAISLLLIPRSVNKIGEKAFPDNMQLHANSGRYAQSYAKTHSHPIFTPRGEMPTGSKR